MSLGVVHLRALLLTSLSVAACVPPEARRLQRAVEPALVATPSEGIHIVRTKSGGRALPVELGWVSVGLGYGAEGYSVGGFGVGGGGLGGRGRGGARVSIGARGGGVELAGDEGSSFDGGDRERSAFAWAEVALPYRLGPPARFEGRADASVGPVVETRGDLLSTFAVDVDTAAYSIARRTIASGRLPEPTMVRVEELVNYFRYDYEPPTEGRGLFSIAADGARSPANPGEHLLRIGLQARVVEDVDRLPANVVFLVDTSCSMTSGDKLPLAKASMMVALEHLAPHDHVAITTYAGGVSLVLPPTPARERARIAAAIAGLSNGGGTAMASGLELAYVQAAKLLGPDTITRIIVLSDGDANIGATKPEDMLATVASYVSEGVKLSTIGFGDGNYRDATMEQLANRGNGNYYYVDTMTQARRVFGRDLTKMLQDVAEDVKIQVELDPAAVRSYRLVGYENRAIADEDFRDDRVDAGEIGAGHQVTAIYALSLEPGARRGRLATVRVRAKRPLGRTAKEVAVHVPVGLVDRSFDAAPDDLRVAIAVMGAAELLRKSPHARGWSYGRVLELLARTTVAEDADRQELLALVEGARRLSPGSERR